MTPKSLFIGLINLLKNLEISGTKVFGENGVSLVSEIPIQQLSTYQNNHAFVIDHGAVNYSHHDDLMRQEFSITLFREHIGNRYGDLVLLGGDDGPGLFDIEQSIINALRTTVAFSSAKITIKSRNKPQGKHVKNNAPHILKPLLFYSTVSLNESDDPAVADIIRAPGFLYWNPPNIAADQFGTKLGYLDNGINFDPDFGVKYLTSMDSGNEITGVYYTGNVCHIEAGFLSYNAETVAKITPGMATGKNISIGTAKTGRNMGSNDSGKLVFVPDDTTNNIVIVFPKAVPYWAGTSNFYRHDDTRFGVRFVALKQSGVICYIGEKSSAP